jgi:tetratricopeptide (TPR) repeat protein
MVLRQLRRHPFLAVGWFWYLIMLIPVIGFIQVGGQAMADRYTYLPFIGPFIMIVWCAGEAVPTTSIFHARALVVAAVGILVILCGLAFVQVSYWSDSITLFTHTLTVTSGNAVAHTSLGTALARQGRLEEAIAHFDAALQIKYGDVETHRNMGLALADLGRLDEAIAQFRETLKINPGDRLARSFLDYYQSKQKEDMNSNVASSAESGNLRK